MSDALAKLFPEVGAGGFSLADGTVAFYIRVDALLMPQTRLLDFGAGRGGWFYDDPCAYHRRLRDFRGRVASVVACDVDHVVLEHPAAERAFVFEPGKPLPLADASLDLIVSDFVLEHVEDPAAFAQEVHRLLAPGGWFCARTPHALHYVSIVSRMLPKRVGKAALSASQPDRKIKDVFPAFYRMNSRKDIAAAFPVDQFADHTFIFPAEPGYHFGSPLIYRTLQAAHAVLPKQMSGTLFVFLQKRA